MILNYYCSLDYKSRLSLNCVLYLRQCLDFQEIASTKQYGSHSCGWDALHYMEKVNTISDDLYKLNATHIDLIINAILVFLGFK